MHTITIYDERDRDRFMRSVNKAPLVDDQGRRLHFVVKRLQQSETESMHGLYRVWMSYLSNEIGEDAGRLAKEVQRELLGVDENDAPVSTKTLTSKRMWQDFLTRVEVLAADFYDIQLPPAQRR